MTESEKLLTQGEAAEILAVKADTLSQWRKDGRGPPYSKLVGTVRYQIGDLRAFISQSRCEAGSA